MKSVVKKTALLALAAVVLTVLLEVFPLNFRAWQSRGMETEVLDLTMATDQYGNYPSFDGEPILIEPTENNNYTLNFTDIYVESYTLRVRMSGTPLLMNYTINVCDEGDEFRYVTAYEGIVMPSDPRANEILCSVHSSGTLYGLQISFKLPYAPVREIYIESVEINPSDVPIRMEPLRMGLCFLFLFIALCMWRLPWQKVVYRPGRWSHRAVLLVCMILVMTVNGVIVFHKTDPVEGDPTRGLFTPMTEAEATDVFNDIHARLFLAFQHGQLHMLDKPPAELAEISNPYDQSARDEHGIWYPIDYVYYNGNYYCYFGPAPLLVYYPFYWLTGGIPSMNFVAFILSILVIPAIFYAMIGLARKFGGKVNLFLLALCCMACALVGAGPFLGVGTSRYDNTILSNLLMMSLAIGFGMHATLAKTGKGRVTRFLLCGLFFGLNVMGRPNTLFMTTGFLAPAFIGVLAHKEAPWRKKLRDAACFLVPALVLLGLAMGYNYARFGSVSEFGATYQLTGEDVRYNVFQPEYIVQALAYYILSPFGFRPSFPYIEANVTPINVTGNCHFHRAGTGVMAFPLMWALLLLPYAFGKLKAEKRALGVQTAATWIAPMLIALPLMVVSHFYGGIIERYCFDFLLPFSLVSAVMALYLLDGSDGDHRALRGLRTLFVIACLASCLAGILYSFSVTDIPRHDPAWYARLTQMFFPY